MTASLEPAAVQQRESQQTGIDLEDSQPHRKRRGFLNPEMVRSISFWTTSACILVAVLSASLAIWRFSGADIPLHFCCVREFDFDACVFSKALSLCVRLRRLRVKRCPLPKDCLQANDPVRIAIEITIAKTLLLKRILLDEISCRLPDWQT